MTLNERIKEARDQAEAAAKVDPVACAVFYLGLVMERQYLGGSDDPDAYTTEPF